MERRSLLAETLSQKWERLHPKPHTFVGFDGFTDTIFQAVDRRIDDTSYVPMEKMSQFGGRVSEAAGESLNLELVERQVKIGGNGPILASALLAVGHSVSLAGAIGVKEEIEPLFKNFAAKCERVYPIAPSGHTDAIEFYDGKIILGKHQNIVSIDYPSLLHAIGKKEWIDQLDRSKLFACGNWTMLPHMTHIWESMQTELLPHLTQSKTRWMFVDLADPAKRSDEDLRQALTTLSQFSKIYRVVLGLNEAEARRVASLFPHSENLTPEQAARHLFNETNLSRIVIHANSFALSASQEGVISVNGPYTPTPKLTTGAGDNFNGGYCHALLLDCNPKECLVTGVSTSGYYVRHGKSPTLSELLNFINEWTSV